MEVPFVDEQSFKAWCHPAQPSAASRPAREMPPPGQDGTPLTAHEQHLHKQLAQLVRAENKHIVDATPGLVARFVRGYVLRSFKTHSDPVDDAAVLLNMSCEWRRSLVASGAAHLHAAPLDAAELPGRAAWDKLCPQSWNGRDKQGRVVFYSKWCAAAAIDTLPVAKAQPLHFQDMLRLEATKAAVSAAAMAAGDTTGQTHHHVVVVDMSNGDGGAGISRAMLKYLKAIGAATATADGSKEAHPTGPSATQHFFPDVLERAIIINAPLLFRALWSIAKRFMEPETVAKYTICGSEFAGVLDAAGIPPEALPRCCSGYGTGPNPTGLVATPTVAKLKRTGATASQTVAVTRQRQGTVRVNWKVALPKGAKGAAVRVTLITPGGAQDRGILKIGSTNVNSKSSPMQKRPVSMSGSLSVQQQKRTPAQAAADSLLPSAAQAGGDVEVELDDMADLPPLETVVLTIQVTSLTNSNVTAHILVDPHDSEPSARASPPLQKKVPAAPASDAGVGAVAVAVPDALQVVG